VRQPDLLGQRNMLDEMKSDPTNVGADIDCCVKLAVDSGNCFWFVHQTVKDFEIDVMRGEQFHLEIGLTTSRSEKREAILRSIFFTVYIFALRGISKR